MAATFKSSCFVANCHNPAEPGNMYCGDCGSKLLGPSALLKDMPPKDHGDRRHTDPSMSLKYPKYYKSIPSGVTDIDIYMLCHMFKVEDHSGALHHAIKKILLPGVRTGGKTRHDDIKEARDTLSRWLEIHK